MKNDIFVKLQVCMLVSCSIFTIPFSFFYPSAAKQLTELHGDHQTFIDKTNNCGATALLVAAQNNKIEVVRILLETVSSSSDCFVLSFQIYRAYRDVIRNASFTYCKLP